jgi:hypothetical protein
MKIKLKVASYGKNRKHVEIPKLYCADYPIGETVIIQKMRKKDVQKT